MEIKNSGIVVILAREDILIQIRWVNIRDGMLVSIPTSEAHIQATHESSLAINQAQLLVMGPIQDNIVIHSIEALQCILGHLAEARRVQRHVLER